MPEWLRGRSQVPLKKFAWVQVPLQTSFLQVLLHHKTNMIKDIYIFTALVVAAITVTVLAPTPLTSLVLILTGITMLLTINESESLQVHRRYAAYSFIGSGALLYFYSYDKAKYTNSRFIPSY